MRLESTRRVLQVRSTNSTSGPVEKAFDDLLLFSDMSARLKISYSWNTGLPNWATVVHPVPMANFKFSIPSC